MTKNEFTRRFMLSPLHDSMGVPRHEKKQPLAAAAVLIPLTSSAGEHSVKSFTPSLKQPSTAEGLSVILTKRAMHLRHHPGQIAFPGGKVEKDDHSIIATALRETQEEIGVSPDQINVLGCLRDYQTVSGFNVTPVVAIVEQEQQYIIDNNEVSAVIEVPLQHFISHREYSNKNKLETYHEGTKRHVFVMPYNQHIIWGATAAILNDLTTQITP